MLQNVKSSNLNASTFNLCSMQHNQCFAVTSTNATLSACPDIPRSTPKREILLFEYFSNHIHGGLHQANCTLNNLAIHIEKACSNKQSTTFFTVFGQPGSCADSRRGNILFFLIGSSQFQRCNIRFYRQTVSFLFPMCYNMLSHMNPKSRVNLLSLQLLKQKS